MTIMGKIDGKNARILDELRKDSRQSTADISRRLSIPRVTVHERIMRMREEGIIKRFTVEPDYGLLGKPVKAFVLVGFAQNQKMTQRQLAEEIAKIEQVHEVAILAGDWDLLLKVRAESIEALGKLVVDRIRNLPGIGRTVTMPALATQKEEV
jgi:Lrp/AsnC family leucine-responsive transcriptional regulator